MITGRVPPDHPETARFTGNSLPSAHLPRLDRAARVVEIA
jgi:hypothetical protein